MASGIEAVTMPKFGMAMTEGKIVDWLVALGAPVKLGQDLAEIETEKITNVYESPSVGVMRRYVVALQATAPVGALIAVLAGSDVSETDVDSFVAGFQGVAFSESSRDTAGMKTRTIKIGDEHISYIDMGAASDTPIVMIHGFGGDANSWLFNQEILSRRTRVIAPDLPGHGGSAKSVGKGNLSELASRLLAFLDALAIERAHLVAHSLGGAIALQIATEQPARVASLSLISAAGVGATIDDGFIQGFLKADRVKSMQAALEPLFVERNRVTRQMADDVLKAKRLDGATEALVAIAAANFKAGRQSRSFQDQLSNMRMPIQIIWGSADRIIDPAQARALPTSVEIHILADAAHMAHMEQPAEVNRLISNFISIRF